MFTITLEPHSEKIWRGDNPSPDIFSLQRPPLLHQWRTYNTEEPLIINTYNTGTGKTKAALLRLLKRTQDKQSPLDSTEDNALLIAPTNALLKQHKDDAEDFCQKNKLPYRVVAISRADLDNYRDLPDFSEADLRRGAALHYIIQNARRLNNDSSSKKATLFVVNPDIFYYALYFCYCRHDRIPLFQDFLSQFSYIIIDEFHYYNPKQFANFLFFMRLSQHYGFTNRQFCLLTATPSKQVQEYLERLNINIAWIQPETENEAENTETVCALAPVILEVYSEKDLKDGVLTLTDYKRREIAQWLKNGEDGAIISGALWRINLAYNTLKFTISTSDMGRLTGAESSLGRGESEGKHLILATPTVDIGYNFDRPDKTGRQNIDFLLFDSRSSDEFIQRLGRAARVLSKERRDILSHVIAVVNQDLYNALKPYSGQTLSRLVLRQLAEQHMPARHMLYSYIQSGAISEAFLPIYRLEGMASEADKPDIEELFNEVKNLFAPEAKFSYVDMRKIIGRFIRQDQYYSGMDRFPADISDCLAKCKKGLLAEQQYREKKGKKLWINAQEAYDWLQGDLCEYFTEKARFSFRESFQPPLALVSDTYRFLSSEPTCVYDALHVARNYRAIFFTSREKWEQQTQLKPPADAKDALIYCDLIEIREPDERLRIGLKLIAGNYTKSSWEERFVYRSGEKQPTALYGLEVIALNSSRPLNEKVKNIFKERYIPAFVATEESRVASQLWFLQRQGQISPYELLVTFCDLKEAKYFVVLGTLALQVWTHVLPYYRKLDERKAQKDDDSPMIC